MKKFFVTMALVITTFCFTASLHAEEIVVPLWEFGASAVDTLAAGTATTNFFLVTDAGSTATQYRIYFALSGNALNLGQTTTGSGERLATQATITAGTGVSILNGTGLTLIDLLPSTYNFGAARILTNATAGTESALNVFVSVVVGTSTFSVTTTQTSNSVSF